MKIGDPLPSKQSGKYSLLLYWELSPAGDMGGGFMTYEPNYVYVS